MKKVILLTIALLTVLSSCTEVKTINSFEECIAAGNPAMESYPMKCIADGKTFVQVIEEPTPTTPCESAGGTWIESANECEGIPETLCIQMGGIFDECGSACRNDPNAQICTMQCVMVCSFDEEQNNDQIHHCTQEEKENMMCTFDYSPVCGDNGKTYGNGCGACASGEIDSYSNGECQKPIGGERDEHGCLGPAGYSYDKEIGACIRTWELEENQREAAKFAVAPLSYPVTVVEVQVLRCPGCFIVELQRNDNQNMQTITIEDWKIK